MRRGETPSAIFLRSMMRIRKNDLFGGALGIFATIGQVVLMREVLTVAGGIELAVAMGFSGWFIGVAAGAILVSRIKADPSRRTLVTLLGTLLMLGALVFLRLHRGFIDVPSGSDPPLSAMAGLISLGCGSGGLVAGALFTIAARALSQSDSTAVSRLYIAESVGALAGGLLFTFVLGSHVPHLVSVAAAGGVVIAISALDRIPPLLRWSGLGVFLLLGIGVVSGGLVKADHIMNEKAFAMLRAATYIVTKESAYGRISLGRLGEQYELTTDGRSESVFPDPWERAPIVHLALTQHPSPKSVLLVGGGPSDRLEAALAHHLDRVVLTHLNRRTFEMCAPFWSPSTRHALADPRVTVVSDDGRRYVANTDDRFDVVIVLAPPPLSAGANRYYTVEFYRAVKRILAPHGVLTTRSVGGANVLANEAARISAAMAATLRAVFRHVAVVPGVDLIFHAGDTSGTVEMNPERLAARYDRRQVAAAAFSAGRFAEIYDAGRAASVTEQLEKQPPLINRDDKPLIFGMQLQLWERTLGALGGAERGITGTLSKWGLAMALVPILYILIRRIGFRLLKRAGAAKQEATLSIATTGAAGMGVQWVVLYTHQSVHGTLYGALALLTALFMAGLTLGAYLSRRFLGKGTRLEAAIVDFLFFIFLAATGPVLGRFAHHELFLLLWSTLAGAFTGAAFPAMLRLAARCRSGDERRAAAAIESSDHLGAAIGAFVTGIIWLPAFGVTVTALFFSAFKLAGLVGDSSAASLRWLKSTHTPPR
jgi:spermidine synthase